MSVIIEYDLEEQRGGPVELGYEFQAGENPDSLGHKLLIFNLYASPTGRHFDPHHVGLVIDFSERGVRHEILSFPLDSNEYHVCLGRITLLDFTNKEVEAFNFGGRLLAENQEGLAACRLITPAPIFHIHAYNKYETLLACEYEAELARLRAQWKRDDLDFDDCLADIDPVTIFLALTKDIQQLLSEIPATHRSDHYWELRHAIQSAIRFIAPDGQLPPGTIGAKDLLKFSLESSTHDNLNQLP
jgi:hypothetical protein